MTTRPQWGSSLVLLGALLAAFAVLTATALGGSGRGSNFNLGKTNSVSRQSVLTGSAGRAAQLKVRNKGRGPALEAVVRRGVPPFKVNSSGKVANLNADLLDGLDSARFYRTGSTVANANALDGLDGPSYQRRVTGNCAAGAAIRAVSADGTVTCQLIGTAFWSLTGNAGTDPATQFLGTTDAQPLVVKTNNAEVLRVTPEGRVGIGTTATVAKAQVLASTGTGIYAEATVGDGVMGESFASNGRGVIGQAGGGTGVAGFSESGFGVQGNATTGVGVLGNGSTRGVVGTLGSVGCPGQYAVGGCAGQAVATGVFGRSIGNAGVTGSTDIGDIFLGVVEEQEIRKFRVDFTGKGFFNGGTQTGGADYAESMRTTDRAGDLEPGDVLAIDAGRGPSVRRSRAPNSPLVAGVYSTKPAVLAVGEQGVDDSLQGEVPVALLGVVPTKVSAENGAVRPGDLLTTARTPGHAMRARPLVIRGVKIYPTGAILGKALQPLGKGKGKIKVLVMLR